MARQKREDEIAELAERLRTIITPLARQLRQHANGGLTPSLLSAIGTIARKGPITLGDLAAQERVSPPMITKVVASLEAQGLVERTARRGFRRLGLAATSGWPDGWRR